MTSERRGIEWVRPAKISPDGGPGGLRAYKVVNASDYPDSIACHTWDGTDEGDEIIHVAKPWWLRRTPFHGLTVDGVGYVYSGMNKRDETVGGVTVTKIIKKPYDKGNIIWATPDGRSGVTVDDEPAKWIDDNRTARDWVAETAASDIIQMKIQSVADNHLVCRTWDQDADPQLGDTDINVAKPWLLRLANWEGVTRLGIKYTKVFEWQRRAELLSTGQFRLEDVEPRYLAGDIIKVASPVEGGVALSVGGDTLAHEDINAEGRHFHEQAEFARPGILWMCAYDGLSTRRIFILDPDNFCVRCERVSPGLFPSGIGGDHDVMYHCDKSDDLLYKFNITTFEVESSYTSIDATPNGIGGTSSVVYHCDITAAKLYKLDPSDMTVIPPTEDSPGSGPAGIGGDNGIIWHCDFSSVENAIYRIRASDWMILDQNDRPTPGNTPSGIGGDSNGIWYCDANPDFIYELATDFTVIRKRVAPLGATQGIGGKLS